MKSLSSVALAAAAILMTGLNVMATPFVASGTGTFSDGSSYTISGSGFGHKNQAAPWKYDNFSSGAPGATLTGWSLLSSNDYGPAIDPTYSTDYLRPNSTRSAECHFENLQYASNFGLISAQQTTKYYIDGWYLEYQQDFPDTVISNDKQFRAYGPHSGFPEALMSHNCDPRQCMWQDTPGDGGVGCGRNTYYFPWHYTSAEGQWVHLQAYWTCSSAPGVADGITQLWIDGTKYIDLSDFCDRDTSYPNMFQQLWFGHYMKHNSEPPTCNGDHEVADTYWSDVYVDTTRARVEIGDQPTYDSCVHREIQIPTAWTAGSITFTVHHGSFGSNADVYLFVSDSTGAVNPTGYPVSLGGGGDYVRPAPITNLSVYSVTTTTATLHWTAVGGDSLSGRGSSYDLRYSPKTITSANFDSATTFPISAPDTSGTPESATVTGLGPGTLYYFAIKTVDEANNWSAISNVPSGTTQAAPDTIPPAAVTDLAVGATTQNAATLTWTAVGDDGKVGRATSYDLRYSTALITDGNWGSATKVPGLPAPKPSGQPETFTVTGLNPATTYYFALKVADEVPNWSALSNVPSGTTQATTGMIIISAVPYRCDTAGATYELAGNLRWHQSAGDAIQVYTHDVTILGDGYSITGDSTGTNHAGLEFGTTAYNTTVRDLTIYDKGPGGDYTVKNDAPVDNITIQGCRFLSEHATWHLDGSCTVSNSIFYSKTEYGVYIDSLGPGATAAFSNCTIVGPGLGLGGNLYPSAGSVVARNCLLARTAGTNSCVDFSRHPAWTRLTLDHCHYTYPGTAIVAYQNTVYNSSNIGTLDANNSLGDPGLVDSGWTILSNFCPASGSPLRNAGDDAAARIPGAIFDAGGHSRVSGAHVDKGAFEYQEGEPLIACCDGARSACVLVNSASCANGEDTNSGQGSCSPDPCGRGPGHHASGRGDRSRRGSDHADHGDLDLDGGGRRRQGRHGHDLRSEVLDRVDHGWQLGLGHEGPRAPASEAFRSA